MRRDELKASEGVRITPRLGHMVRTGLQPVRSAERRVIRTPPGPFGLGEGTGILENGGTMHTPAAKRPAERSRDEHAF